MILVDRSPMPFGPHAGKPMSRVPAEWLEEFSSQAHPPTEDMDAVIRYIHINRRRIDSILDAQEDRA